MWRRSGEEGFESFSQEVAKGYVRRNLRPKDRSFALGFHYRSAIKSYTTTHLRRLSVTPDSTQPPSQEELTETAITQLKTTDDWTSDISLHQQLLSLPPQSLVKIARQFETSSKALKIFHFIHDNQSLSVSQLPLSSIFQTVLELSIREEDSVSLVDLFNLSKELKVPLTPNSAIVLIRYFSRVKKIEESMQLYNELEPDAKSTNVKNTLLGLLLGCNKFEDAHNLLDEMLQPDTKFPPNETTLSAVFSVLIRWNWGKEDEKIIGFIPKFGIHGVFPCNVWLTQLSTRLCRSHRNGKAWDLLPELMKFGKLETGPFNSLLSGLSKERNYNRIKLLLNKMKENNIKPDKYTFRMLVNHLCKVHRVDEALEMLKKMKDGIDGVSIKPDVIIYNTLIDGLCKVGWQEEGFLLMEEIKLEHNYAPNGIIYNCLIDGFCKSSEIKRAQELFDQMNKENVVPNVIIVNTLVDGMCKHGRISNVMEFFRKMQEEKAQMSGTTVTFVIIEGLIVIVSSVGNSRCILESADGSVYYLSADHRLDTNEEERNRVTASGGEVGRLNTGGGTEIGPFRCWPGGLSLSRSIGDRDVGEFIVPVPYVKQVKVSYTLYA